MKFDSWFLNLKNGWFYIFLIVVSAVFVYLSNFYLTEVIAYNVLSEQYTLAQIQKIISSLKAWQYLAYLFIPIIIIIRVLYTSFCLYAGSLFQEYKWQFRSVFNIALKADIIFLFSQILNFYYYLFFKEAQTIDEINTNFLSVLNVVGQESTPSWLISAFNSANIFELLYTILLVILLYKSFNQSLIKTAGFVLLTYGVGTYLYVAFMTFIHLNYT